MAGVELIEVCPRDGLQNEATCLSVPQRVELIERLVRAGARRIEAVSFVDPRRVPQMAGAEDVLARVPRGKGVRYSALVLNERGMNRALTTQLDEVNIVVPCTDAMSERNQGCDVDQMVAAAGVMTRQAADAALSVTWTVAVAFGCPFTGEVPLDAVARVIAEAADAGADEIAIADTIGVGVPAQVSRIVTIAADLAPGVALRFHFHNTRNTGYANALQAAAEGVTRLDASVGGFGGCPFAPNATGNVATEDLVYALARSGLSTELDFEHLTATGAWLARQLGVAALGLLGPAGWFPGTVDRGGLSGAANN